MCKGLNSIIKFDLHIHSKASEYKEKNGIVEQSTKDNLSILMSKLNEHGVALFSITDHNRFDPELYLAIIKILNEAPDTYPNVKNILAGVEFDVKFDDEMEKCHITAIFDTNNEEGNLNKIKLGIETKLLNTLEESYSKDEFEKILKEIGLNTILIASQRKDVNNHNGNHNSLSDSVADVEQIIRVGYVNAIEFQKPKVEGILIDNLKELVLPIALFSGSDCHDWRCYPWHDENNQNREFYHSKAKMLPTFKGLLMAITSPETRFNCRERISANSIEALYLKGKKIPFVKGINAVIGENGSGKTTLLELINGKVTAAYIKKIIENNELRVTPNNLSHHMKYINQGQIIQKFHKQALFSDGTDDYFIGIDHEPFKKYYNSFSSNLKECISTTIKKQEMLNSLSKHIIGFQEGMSEKSYYINIIENDNFTDVENPHKEPYRNIKDIENTVKLLLSDEYFLPYNAKLREISTKLNEIYKDIELKYDLIRCEAAVKNIIHGCISDYSRKIRENSSAKDKDVAEYNKNKRQTIDVVVNTIKDSLKTVIWPEVPSIVGGASTNPRQGFCFNREAMYNKKSMVDSFFSKMFISEYNNIEKLKGINSHDQYVKAVRNCTSAVDIDVRWSENLEKFIVDATKTNDYIVDAGNQQIGNTLGEMSLSYYKFYTQDTQDWQVLIVDQPEDNISNNNISQKLISYFNDIRNEKQIIFVTHNPLLVVNLDVDNVIFVKNENGHLNISHGCLEYEDETTNILKLVAENMDGGKETIERRLKVYGKNY